MIHGGTLQHKVVFKGNGSIAQYGNSELIPCWECIMVQIRQGFSQEGPKAKESMAHIDSYPISKGDLPCTCGFYREGTQMD